MTKLTQQAVRLTALMLVITPTIVQPRTKLVTLPERDAILVSLENPAHALLSEEREIPLQQGTNQIDFSWKGVTIDEGSVLLELLTNPGTGANATKIIATGYPPNEQALTWELFAPSARTERVRVSYLLRGISQEASYEFRVNEAETSGDFQQYLLLRNASGERIEGATLRLRGLEDITRTVESGEARRLLAARAKELPVKKLYIAKPGYGMYRDEDGETISLVYEIANSTAGGLGTQTLAAGKVRLHGDDGTGSSIFLGEDMLKLTAPGEKAELTLGTVRDVVLKRYRMGDERKNVKFTTNRQPVAFDLERTIRYEIENFKDSTTTLRVHEPMRGGWEVVSISDGAVRQERKSADELILEIDLAGTEKGKEPVKREVVLTVRMKNTFPGEL
jgi:hypothetical protein